MKTLKNLGIKLKDGFNGIIYNVLDFSDFFYFDAKEEIEKGFFEYRTYLGYNRKNNIKRIRLIKQGIEDKFVWPDEKYYGLTEMEDNN